ncbi:MAG: GIY-YIG nuclease family protein [Gemmatimonadales bacterium]
MRWAIFGASVRDFGYRHAEADLRIDVILSEAKDRPVAPAHVILTPSAASGKDRPATKDSVYYVYILANRNRVLYIGSTSDLRKRVAEHRLGLREGFTHRYSVDRLVYFELTPSSRAMVERERQLKGWRRQRKVDLIEATNPEWRDLGADELGELR